MVPSGASRASRCSHSNAYPKGASPEAPFGVPGAGGPDPLDPSGGGGSTDPSGSTDNSTAATTADAAGAQELADGVAVDQVAAGGAAEGVVGDVPNQVVPAKAAAASMVLIPLAILLLLAVVFVPGLLTRALDRKPKVEP